MTKELLNELKMQLDIVEADPTPANWGKVHAICNQYMLKQLSVHDQRTDLANEVSVEDFDRLIMETAARIEARTKIALETVELMRIYVSDAQN